MVTIILNICVDENNGGDVMTTDLAVEDDLNLLQRAELGKLLLQLPLCRVEAEAENPDAGARGRVVPVAHVAPPVGHGRPTGHETT